MLVRPTLVEPVRINPATGAPEINPDRGMVQAWVQGTQRAARVVVAGSSSAEDAIQVQPERNLSGDYQVAAFTSDHLGAYRVELSVTGGWSRRLMNVPIHVDLIAGSGQFPGYLPVPLFVEARSSIGVKYTNLSTISNSIRFVSHGRRFVDYRSEAERNALLKKAFARLEYPYWLGLNDTSTTLAANATNTRVLMSVPADGDFEAEYLLAVSSGLFRIAIKESTSGRPVMVGGGDTIGVQSTHVTGNAIYPYRFPGGPAWFKRQSDIEVFLDDLSGAANTIELCLVGRLLDYPEASDRAPGPVHEVRAPLTIPGIAGSLPVPSYGASSRRAMPVNEVTPSTVVPNYSPISAKRPWWQG